MSDKLPTKPALDGFDTFEDGVEGEEQRGRGVIQGSGIKFTNEAAWVTRDGEELAADLELVVIDVGRVVQKWINQQPVETRILAPGEKYPDITKLDEQCPREEWTEGPDGKPRGPWQAQHIVYLLNPLTMDRYTFPTGTTGGHIAVADLVDKVKWMRRLRGENVYPVVTLSDTFMNTRFGGRQRPHFIIKRWVGLGEDGKTQALPAPTSPTLPPADATEQPPAAEKPKQDPSGLRTVEEPSVAEDLDDSIPSKGSAGKTDHKHKVGSRAPQAGATTKKRAGSRA